MVWDTAFLPDGEGLISVSGTGAPGVSTRDTSIRKWSLETGGMIHSSEISADVIFQVAVTPDGQTALFTTNDPYVHVWDIKNWEETGLLEGHQGWVPGLAISPDGHNALTCSVDGTLIWWDLQTGEVVHQMGGHGKGLWAVAISPDGRTALSDSGDSSMILWDLEKGVEIRSFTPEEGLEVPGSSGIVFMPDGQTAISGSNGGMIIHWDLETGEEIRRLGRHNDIRTRIEINPDGTLALTSGMDGTLKLWNLERGHMIREFSGTEGAPVFDIAISPDGLTALSGSADTTIIQWRLLNPSQEALKNWIALNRYVRPLSCEERDRYRIEPLCKSGS
jgi:WD40 repeat protein